MKVSSKISIVIMLNLQLYGTVHSRMNTGNISDANFNIQPGMVKYTSMSYCSKRRIESTPAKKHALYMEIRNSFLTGRVVKLLTLQNFINRHVLYHFWP